jgi:hypothetical protein
MRKELSLPPFVNILKFTLENKNEKLKEYIEKVFESLESKMIWHREAKSGNYIGIILIEKKL